MYFRANLHVASTLLAKIKSQINSEYKFRLNWIKSSPRTKAKLLKTGYASTFGQEEAQDSPTPSSWGRLAPWGGWLTRPMDPTTSTLPHGASSLAPKGSSARIGCCSAVVTDICLKYILSYRIFIS